MRLTNIFDSRYVPATQPHRTGRPFSIVREYASLSMPDECRYSRNMSSIHFVIRALPFPTVTPKP